MVIEPGNNINTQASAGKTRQQATPRASDAASNNSAPARASSGDSVSLSSASLSISRIESRLATTSDVDAARVSQVRAAIDSGSYEIDSEAIANGLLRDDQENSI